MKRWIERFFALFRRPNRSTAEAGAAAPAADAPAATAPVRAAAGLPAQIDADELYFRLLLGAEPRNEDARLEALALDALEQLSRSNLNAADLVPRVPAVIPNLLKSLRDQHVSGVQLAHEIERDVVLVAEVLRQANSSYYHPAEPITSLENAVLVLGMNGLRMLIAKVAFHPVINLQSGRLAKMAAPHVWQHSEKCVHACRKLAPEYRVDSFEAFLGGMLQNVGLMVVLRVIDAVLRGSPAPASRSVLHAMPYYARLLSGRIGREWEFPPQVVAAIEERGGSLPDHGNSPLGQLLHRADLLGKLWVLTENGRLAEQEIEQAFWLSESELACFGELKTLAF